MSGHCPRCGVYAEEDDDRLCASCKGDRATPQPPTLDELRDWHAERAGWKYIKRSFNEEEWFRTSPFGEVATHPFPPTLDGAASAMPEGWWWFRYPNIIGGLVWVARPTPDHRANRQWFHAEAVEVVVPDTGDEKYDRYLLAQRAHEKEATP